LLNSTLIDWYYGFIGKPKGKSREYFNKPLSEIPISIVPIASQQPFIEKTNDMFEFNKQLHARKTRFYSRIKSSFEIEKISKKIEGFYNFEFKTFVAELKKQKVILALMQQDEWEEYFIAYKTEINQLQTEITQTDKEIDQMVYELYGLTEEEIKIVENS